jgi:DTW domain-containing protein YfiP
MTAPDLKGRCPRCWLRTPLCLCDALGRASTRTRFVIVRHALEALKSTNSARIAALMLPAVEVVTWGNPGAPFDATKLAVDDAALLYPGGGGDLRPQVLVVPDGTWHQTRHMVRRLFAHVPLRRFSVEPPAAAPRLRRAAHAGQVSTLEAIAAAVERLEGMEAARPLFDAHRLLVERTLRGRGRVGE